MRIAVIPPGRFRSTRRFLLVGIVLLVVTIGASGLIIWDLRREALENARQDVANLGLVLAEHTSRSLQAVDLVLSEISGQIHSTGVETSEQMRQAVGTERFHQLL